MIIIRKIIFILVFYLLTGAFFVQKANAEILLNASDTITTSRPSAAAPLEENVAVTDKWAQILDNGSLFLASDSAVLLEPTNFDKLEVSFMSAPNVPYSGSRIVYFANAAVYAHHRGDILVSPVTATHTIIFQTKRQIPSGGRIQIAFPAIGNNTASPSAYGFAMNGELSTPTDVICFPTTACGGGKAFDTYNIFTFTTSGIQATGTLIYINIGCTNTAAGPCTAFKPRIINPTKTAAAGTADAWRINIETQDTSGNGYAVIDTAIVKVFTIESVQVQALVEPVLTFTIAGLTTSENYNTVVPECASETSTSGINSTATFVNLGILNTSGPNTAAQLLTVSTNAGGYAITATSSGRLINRAGGFSLPDGNGGNGLTANNVPAPLPIPVNGTAFFGISPCGANVNSDFWGASGTTMTAGSARVLNPWNSGTDRFISNIATSILPLSSNAKTIVRYGAEIDNKTMSGIYTTLLTYIATATF